MAVFRVSRTKFLGPITPTAESSPLPDNLPTTPQAQLALLCQTVLAGKHIEARALAARFVAPKPKGSDTLQCWFDGAAGPMNPGGHGAYGLLVKNRGVIVHQESQYIGHGPHISNNVSEYAGALAALKYLLAKGIRLATVYGDSQMVIRQLDGQMKAKRGLYLPLYREARELRARLPDVRLAWIPRGMNTEADELSKEPLRLFLGE
jgi:ribonuclease HI